jgi:two-component system, sensor histidine kinase
MAACFPCQHPEQVRIAQSIAMMRQLRGNAAFIVSMMALGLATQLQAGFGWAALAWQVAMGSLVYAALGSFLRLHQLPPPMRVSMRHIRSLTLSSAACGLVWSLGMLWWTPRADAQFALMAIAVSMAYTLHAVAACYFMPWAAIAFAAPLFAASMLVAATSLQAPMVEICIVLIVLHGLASLHELRRSWLTFSHAIDLDVQTSRLASMLQEQKQIAEDAVHLKSRFLASASHDLRQPMHAISLYLDGLAEADLPKRIRDIIIDARICAHDMIDMFRSLLDMSRLDAHQAVPSLSVFGIGAVLSRVEKEFSPLATSRGISLKVRPCDEHVFSDPVMVERIALNFVSNAVRHTQKGRVLVGCRVSERRLRLAVYDTGAGIAVEDQQKIFDEFRRLDSRPHDHTGGLGLGLAIVHRLAQALRLEVIVRSTVGRGSMFAVDLPLVHVPRVKPEAPAGGPGLAGRLVVLVDDEPSILDAATFILETAGCEVVPALSPSEALDVVAACTRVPDAIVCDFELNDARNGFDVIRGLREEFACDIPALLVTGNTVGGEAEESARTLAVPILYKPLEAAALRGSIESLLAQREATP